MNELKIGDKLEIQCYKHDGRVYNAWNEAVLLEVHKDYLVFGNSDTLVTEVNGSKWKTKEPAILYFFKEEWFNIIAQLKETGISYYCNIATPAIIEDRTIKYIDYDLDLRIFPTGEFKILDKLEYQRHKREMQYNDKLDNVIHLGLNRLIERYKNKEIMFSAHKNLEYYEKYKELLLTCKYI